MPIYLKESKKDPATPGSSASEGTRLKQLVVALHEQIKKMTVTVRNLKSEKRALEQQVTQKDHELKQLKQELLQLKHQSRRRNVGHPEFGD